MAPDTRRLEVSISTTSARGLALLLCLLGAAALRLETPGSEGGGALTETCTSGSFGSTPYLEGVQTLVANAEPLSFRNFKHEEGHGTEGLLACPKTKFALCTIEKNGCSTWLTLWGRMVHDNVSISRPNYYQVHQSWSEDAASEVFHDRRALRALWVRDPLERFLSAFLDKCVNTASHLDYLNNCPFARNPSDRFAEPRPMGFPLSRARSWLRAGGAFDNGHFAPQSSHCELRKRLHEYNTIGLMTSANFANNAECILKRAGLLHLNQRADGQPLLRHPVNPGKARTGTQNVLKRFFTKEFAHELMDLFTDDYDLFRLKRPTWVDEATGEWFNRASAHLKDHKSPHPLDESGLQFEDDIVAEAERGGFYLPAA